MLIHEGVERTATATPGLPAVVTGGGAVTYGELWERALGWGRSLRKQLPAGARVAVSLPPGPAYLAAVLGLAAAGLAAVPCHPRLGARERQRLAGLGCARVLEGNLPAPGPAGTGPAPPRPAPDDVFAVFLTSGSTGEPRPVPRPHSSWTLSFPAMTAVFEGRPGAVVAAGGSLGYSAVLIAALWALSLGGTAVLPVGPRGAALSPRTALALLDACGAEIAFFVPPAYERLCAAREAGAPAPRRLRTLLSAGTKLGSGLRARLGRSFPGSRVYEYYGSVEAGFVSVLRPEEAPGREASVGRAFPGVEVAVGAPGAAPSPEPADIWARSPYSARPGQWVRTGDRGRLDPAGFLYLAGRNGELIVQGGTKLHPGEVETVLLTVGGVREAVVIGRPDPVYGQRAVAYVVAGVPRPSRARLLAACRAALGPHGAPLEIHLVTSLPRTAAGKVDRRALQKAAAEGRHPSP